MTTTRIYDKDFLFSDEAFRLKLTQESTWEVFSIHDFMFFIMDEGLIDVYDPDNFLAIEIEEKLDPVKGWVPARAYSWKAIEHAFHLGQSKGGTIFEDFYNFVKTETDE